MGFNLASHFLQENWRQAAGWKRLSIAHPTRKITKGAGIDIDWETKQDHWRIQDTLSYYISGGSGEEERQENAEKYD